jgi:hypothetical protein
MRGILSLLFLSRLAAGSPLSVRDILSAKSLSIGDISWGVDPDNLDILVPNEVNGTFERPASHQKRDAILAPLLRRQAPEPGQYVQINNGQCSKQAKYSPAKSGLSCSIYCQMMSHVVTGAIQQVSDDVQCTTPTCPATYAQSKTLTYTWSINANIQLSAKIKPGDVEYGPQASFGFSYSWATSTTTGNTYGYNPGNGDKGHIIFIPYMAETCGTLTYFYTDPTTQQCYDWIMRGSNAMVTGFDPMSCGQAPINLGNDNNNAAGVSFGNIGFAFRETVLIFSIGLQFLPH